MMTCSKPRKCDFAGCTSAATVEARKLWGAGGSLFCCSQHKPDRSKRPAALQHLPFCYEVVPIAEAGQ